MRVLGLISGTSHDAIEAAAADFELDGEVVSAKLLAKSSTPYAPELRSRLVDALPPAQTTIEEVCKLDTEIGRAFAEAATELLTRLPDGAADLVASHGQTVYHWVDGPTARGTLQLGQPAWIADRTGLPVVADLRIRDIAAGGHGAPLASIFDVLLLSGSSRTAAALNLGGIANITVVRPSAEPIAYDTGPANALLDAAMLAATNGELSYDRGGERSARGAVDEALLDRLLAEPFYALAAPKSTGKELFNAAYLRAHAERTGDDLLATLASLTVETVARELVRHGVETVIASGGGTQNVAIMDGLRERLPDVELRTVNELGVPSEAKEALMIALIGFLTANGLAGAIPSCTGASRAVILGAIVPGAAPLELPPPAATAPTRFELR